MMLEERYEEFRKEIRDPYPSIGEKAVGRLVKINEINPKKSGLFGQLNTREVFWET